MRALISGAAGFIGSNLAKRCLDEGWLITGVDDLSNGHMEFIPDKLDIYTMDFTDPEILELIKNRCFDVVFHLAAIPRVSYSVEHPIETNDVNVTKTLKLMDACRGNVKRFVFASSSSVYGGAGVLPTPTSYPKDPKSPYALQKSIIEDYLRLYGSLYGLENVSLRFFNVFGKNALGLSPYATALAAWLTAIKSGRPMRSDGDGLQSRDLCHVDNVTEACIKAATVDAEPLKMFDRFNVACGTRTTNKEILEYLLKRYPGSTYIDAPWRAGDVMHTQADITLTESILGYEPVVSVWEGIEMTCTWYDENWCWAKGLKQGI